MVGGEKFAPLLYTPKHRLPTHTHAHFTSSRNTLDLLLLYPFTTGLGLLQSASQRCARLRRR